MTRSTAYVEVHIKNKTTVDWGKSKIYDFLPFCVAFRTEKRLSILGYPVEPFTARKAKHTTISLKQKFFQNFKISLIQVECPCRKCALQIEVDSLFQHMRDAHRENTVFTLVDGCGNSNFEILLLFVCEGIYVVFPGIPCLFATQSTSTAWMDPTTHSRIAGATTERGTYAQHSQIKLPYFSRSKFWNMLKINCFTRFIARFQQLYPTWYAWLYVVDGYQVSYSITSFNFPYIYFKLIFF